jgi:predicted RNase H-like HicB family nuclease
MFSYTIEIEREEDGRWIAEVPELPGVMVYGQTQDEAVARVEALALRVLADQIEHAGAGELAMTVSFAGAA